MKSSIQKEYPKLVKQPCIQCDGTGETTFSGTYNSQRKCDLCNGKGYIDSKDISQMQSDLELIQSLQKPKQETLEEVAENYANYNEQINKAVQEAVKFGANCQAKRMYSEEEVKHIVSEALQSALVNVDLEQWFKQFKKK